MQSQLQCAKEQFDLDVRKYSFSRIAINELIRCPADCVNASSINEAGLL